MSARPFALVLARSAAAAALAFAIVFCVGMGSARTGDSGDYAAPDLSAYYAGLKMPDMDISCCHEGDAYYADKTEACTEADGAECALVAIVTDTRADNRALPDGRQINRMHIDPGTRIVVGREKLRRRPIANPTEHTILFVNAGWFPRAMCWEPVGGF